MTYEEFCERIDNGSRWSTNLKTFKVVVDGETVSNHTDFLEWNPNADDLAIAYANYKSSVPSRKPKKSIFKAKTIEELTDEELYNGEDRDTALAKLEAMVILYVLNNPFPNKGWFLKFGELILLKKLWDNKIKGDKTNE